MFNFKFKLILIEQKTYVNNFFINFWLSMILVEPVESVWILNTRHCRTTRGHGETARRGRERSEVGGQRSEDRGRKADDGQLTLRLV
jgi:hypothetical protein